MNKTNEEKELVFEQVLIEKIKQVVKSETSFETLFDLIILPVLKKHVIKSIGNKHIIRV